MMEGRIKEFAWRPKGWSSCLYSRRIWSYNPLTTKSLILKLRAEIVSAGLRLEVNRLIT